MRILFAAPDRDLVRCYSLLLAGDGREVDTACDGVAVLEKLSLGGWDLLILTRDLPRIPSRQIVAHCRREALPVILLTPRPPSLGELLDQALPWALLPLPFLPEELEALVGRVIGTAASQKTLSLEGRAIPLAGFRLGQAPLTLGELEALEALAEGAQPPEDRMCLGALNEKLSAQGFSARIRYRAGEGYRLVTDHE